MKKMTKGALAIGVGAAMLLGGGGTLATWNDRESAAAGTIIAGDLDLAATPGAWSIKTAAGEKEILDIAQFRAVPGDVLTFTQDITVKLEGDNLAARVEIDKKFVNKFTGNTLPAVSLKNSDGVNVDGATLDPNTDGKFTAQAVFTFDADTAGQENTKATLDLTQAGYTLTQVAAK